MSLFKSMLLVCLVVSIPPKTLATSLYEEGKFKALHEDKKAFALGDGLTILIYENAQAVSSTGEGSRADVSFSGGASVDERNWSTGLNVGSSQSGDAATNRKGFVRAQLTAVVVEKTEDGALVINGEQKIRINEEEQVIRVSGRVRPEDISNQNTVASYRIQNAQISVDGEGDMSKDKEGNVFVRLIKWMGF